MPGSNSWASFTPAASRGDHHHRNIKASSDSRAQSDFTGGFSVNLHPVNKPCHRMLHHASQSPCHRVVTDIHSARKRAINPRHHSHRGGSVSRNESGSGFELIRKKVFAIPVRIFHKNLSGTGSLCSSNRGIHIGGHALPSPTIVKMVAVWTTTLRPRNEPRNALNVRSDINLHRVLGYRGFDLVDATDRRSRAERGNHGTVFLVGEFDGTLYGCFIQILSLQDVFDRERRKGSWIRSTMRCAFTFDLHSIVRDLLLFFSRIETTSIAEQAAPAAKKLPKESGLRLPRPLPDKRPSRACCPSA